MRTTLFSLCSLIGLAGAVPAARSQSTTPAEPAPAPAPAPAPEVEKILESLGYVASGSDAGTADQATERGYIGVEIAFEDGAIIVRGLLAGGPAAAAGLQPGDSLKISGHSFEDEAALREHLGGMAAGDELALEVERDGWTKKVQITLAPRSALGASSSPRAGSDSSEEGAPREERERRLRVTTEAAQERAQAQLRELRATRERSRSEPPPAGAETVPPPAPPVVPEGRVEVRSLRGSRLFGASGEDSSAQIEELRQEVRELRAMVEELRRTRQELEELRELRRDIHALIERLDG